MIDWTFLDGLIGRKLVFERDRKRELNMCLALIKKAPTPALSTQTTPSSWKIAMCSPHITYLRYKDTPNKIAMREETISFLD